MLAKVTTLSTLAPLPPDSQFEPKASTAYLINTDNIVEMKVQGTTDSWLKYKLNLKDDRHPAAIFTVNETNAAIQTLADTSAASNMVVLEVYEGARSFGEAALISSTTNKYFNVKHIVLVEQNTAGTISQLWSYEVGHGIRKFYIADNIDQIYDKVDTGTTTTSSTSTSSTSSSSSSTSSSSTSSTSTSSTSSSSTSSTSTSSTSTIA